MSDEQLIELFDERAAIMEFDGGLTREQAEIAARKDLAQLGFDVSALYR